MARGGRRAGGKRGPDLAWDDGEESLATPPVSNKPQETFPVGLMTGMSTSTGY